MSAKTLSFHLLANLFPLLEGKEFETLAADIKAHGLREPVTLLGGKILDGRNRYRACRQAGVECRFEEWKPEKEGDTPLAYVLSLNLQRRHLDESQRAWVAAKLANMKQGRPEKAANLPLLSQEDAAEKLNVSERSVRSAAEVRDRGAAELQKAVENGDVATEEIRGHYWRMARPGGKGERARHRPASQGRGARRARRWRFDGRWSRRRKPKPRIIRRRAAEEKR